MLGGNLMLSIWLWTSIGCLVLTLIVLYRWYRPEDISGEDEE